MVNYNKVKISRNLFISTKYGVCSVDKHQSSNINFQDLSIKIMINIIESSFHHLPTPPRPKFTTQPKQSTGDGGKTK